MDCAPSSTPLKKSHISLTLDKVDWIVSSWCFIHLADPMGTFKKAFDILRPGFGIMEIDGFNLISPVDGKEGESFQNVPNLFTALIKGEQPFLIKHDSENPYYNILIKRKDAEELFIPLEYSKEIYGKMQNAAKNWLATYALRNGVKPLDVIIPDRNYENMELYGTDPNFFHECQDVFHGDSPIKWHSIINNEGRSEDPVIIRYDQEIGEDGYILKTNSEYEREMQTFRDEINQVFDIYESAMNTNVYKARYALALATRNVNEIHQTLDAIFMSLENELRNITFDWLAALNEEGEQIIRYIDETEKMVTDNVPSDIEKHNLLRVKLKKNIRDFMDSLNSSRVTKKPNDFESIKFSLLCETRNFMDEIGQKHFFESHVFSYSRRFEISAANYFYECIQKTESINVLKLRILEKKKLIVKHGTV